MNTEAIDGPVELSGWTPEKETNFRAIRWTRQADGTYRREGNLPAAIPTVKIYVIDEDFETNSPTATPGLRLWPKEEAVALVERKIAEGSYKAWRYEIRPEVSSAEVPATTPAAVENQSRDVRLCENSRCKKGPNGSCGVITRSNAKYCSAACRVDSCRCRRRKAKPEEMEKPTRKPRSDRKYRSHAERQRAYDARRGGTERLSRMSVYDLADGAQR